MEYGCESSISAYIIYAQIKFMRGYCGPIIDGKNKHLMSKV
jgi:hypothetical protein